MNIRESMGRRLLLVVLLLGSVYYVYFGPSILPFGFKAKAAECETVETEYEKLWSDLNQARRLAADRERIEQIYEQMHARWSAAREVLPNQDEMAELLRKITMAGESCGVKFYLFKPLTPVPVAFYYENPVEIRVVGGYHQVASFLAEIASLRRLVNVDKLHLVAFKGGEPGETVEASFMAYAYSVMGPRGLATAADAGGQNRGGSPGRSVVPSVVQSEE